jgi:heme exporter protein A
MPWRAPFAPRQSFLAAFVHDPCMSVQAVLAPHRPLEPKVLPATASSGAAAEAGAVLAGRGLACRRGGRLLFRDLDLRLEPGRATWLRGTNGSGKTSLLRILAGLSEPAAGEVSWNGTPLRRAGAAARRGIVYIGHANALKDDLTLAESLAFLATLAELDSPAARARRALAELGLADAAEAPVRTLSQGQRRRGALARLALDDLPRTWLLDEPIDALDNRAVGMLCALIESHCARGGAALLTSHQPIPLAGLAELDLEAWRVA